MMRIECRAGLVVWLAGACIVSPTAAAQPPPTDGVVSVRAADNGGRSARGGLSEGEALGFVTGEFAGEARVLASVADVDPGETDFVVRAGGNDHDARLIDRDPDSGLAVLAVPELIASPLPFARDPAAEGQEVYAATLIVRDSITYVPGRVEDVQPGSTGADPGAVGHNAFSSNRRNSGAPLVNRCGQIVGAVHRDPDPALAGSGSAVPAEWLRTRFVNGLRETVADTSCAPPDPPAAPADPAPPTQPRPTQPRQTLPRPTPTRPTLLRPTLLRPTLPRPTPTRLPTPRR